MSITTDSNTLLAHNPATGAELGRVSGTPPNAVAEAVDRARTAQRLWGERPWKERREALRRWWRVLSSESDPLTDALRLEIGKPRAEALAEVVSMLDNVRWVVRHGGKALADQRFGPGWQRFMLLGTARVRWRPVGVVGIIGTWNYPMFLDVPTIAHALAAGNAVAWKPSELASWCGSHIAETLRKAELPDDLVTPIFGGPEVGKALVEAGVDNGHFTGGVEVGRRVLAAWAERGVPAVAELSGFDAAIVLPDAPLDATANALAWSAFVNAGQACVAIKRIYIIGDARPWMDAIVSKTNALRIGDPSGAVDVGPLISEAARDRFDRILQSALAAGATIRTGGAPIEGPGWFFQPTVLETQDLDPELALEGCFGPVVTLREVPDVASAIAAANASRLGLGASVWARDRRAAGQVAERLDAGMVGINAAVSISAHATAPFGGVKASGFGRNHGPLGLRAFAVPVAYHSRRAGGFRPELFPYSDQIQKILGLYRKLFH